MELLEKFNQKQLVVRPKIRPGDMVRVYQKDTVKEGGKLQIFEGVVVARKGGLRKNATITVRRDTGDVAVEKIYPLHSPVIEKIEVVQRSRVRRAKLYYLRNISGERARLKRKEFDLEKIEPAPKSETKKDPARKDAPDQPPKPEESPEAEVEKLADSQA